MATDLFAVPYNEKMFGSQIYDAFRGVKRAFDPNGIMNPGKIVDSPPMTNSLRIGPAVPANARYTLASRITRKAASRMQ